MVQGNTAKIARSRFPFERVCVRRIQQRPRLRVTNRRRFCLRLAPSFGRRTPSTGLCVTALLSQRYSNSDESAREFSPDGRGGEAFGPPVIFAMQGCASAQQRVTARAAR